MMQKESLEMLPLMFASIESVKNRFIQTSHAWMKQPVGCLTQNDDYFMGGIKRYWNVGFGHIVYFVCFMVDSK
jgi:hypothetical protein